MAIVMKPGQAAQDILKPLRYVLDSIKRWFERFDIHILMGLGMILVAMSIANYPNGTGPASLDAIGISPKGFSYLCAACAVAVVGFKDFGVFLVCSFPIAFYSVVLFDAVGRGNASPAGAFLGLLAYVGCAYAANLEDKLRRPRKDR